MSRHLKGFFLYLRASKASAARLSEPPSLAIVTDQICLTEEPAGFSTNARIRGCTPSASAMHHLDDVLDRTHWLGYVDFALPPAWLVSCSRCSPCGRGRRVCAGYCASR